jgi:hypothetical protein
MKKRNAIAFAGSLILASNLAQAAYVDITIFDGIGSPGNVISGSGPDTRFDPSEREYGEVESGNEATAPWDLRAFGYDSVNNKLLYQGGMNIRNEVGGSGVTATNQIDGNPFGIGSIFIKLGASTIAPVTPNGGSNSSGVLISNSFGAAGGPLSSGFDYAITLLANPSNLNQVNYIIYDLATTSKLRAAFYADNREAGPYAFRPEDNVGGSHSIYQSQNQATVSTGTITGMTDWAGVDYLAEFNLGDDLGGLVESQGAFFYLTQECGNDLMVGQLNASNLVTIPEPSGTAALMGLLLGGAFFRNRRPTAG